MKINMSNLKMQNPNMHINQIYSYFDLEYPKRINNDTKESVNKRKIFRKISCKYKIDNNGRLNAKNPFNNDDDIDMYYKIPYKDEKNFLINNRNIL